MKQILFVLLLIALAFLFSHTCSAQVFPAVVSGSNAVGQCDTVYVVGFDTLTNGWGSSLQWSATVPATTTYAIVFLNSHRHEHLRWVATTFGRLPPDRRVILFCHDPTALPFLAREPAVKERLSQIVLTGIGHLHTPVVLWKSRLLAGMPPVRFLGNAVRRMSTALHEARQWRPFHVRLCPALSGVELLHDGGYARLEIDRDARHPPRYEVIRFPKARGTLPTGLERD